MKIIFDRFDPTFTDVSGKTHVLEHDIELYRDKPINIKPYPIPFALQDMKSDLQNMLDLRVVE